MAAERTANFLIYGQNKSPKWLANIIFCVMLLLHMITKVLEGENYPTLCFVAEQKSCNFFKWLNFLKQLLEQIVFL